MVEATKTEATVAPRTAAPAVVTTLEATLVATEATTGTIKRSMRASALYFLKRKEESGRWKEDRPKAPNHEIINMKLSKCHLT
jgi:hypothetical protein